MASDGRELLSRPSLTARLAAACAAMRYDSLPERTRQWAKTILLDTIGCMLSASRPMFPGPRKLAQVAQAERDDGPCIVVGTDLRASAASAALVNGYLGYALDSESHHGPAVLHAPAVVIPAAMAAAQQGGCDDGAAFLAAVVLGIDVACRVSLSIGPNDLYSRGFHPTAVAGSFGAAAAAGSVLRLPAPRVANALGLAATSTSGLLAWASDATEASRPLHPGLAARNGFVAAWLASLEFGAPQAVFDAEAKYNVFKAWSRDGGGSPETLLDGFGERFLIEELTIKQYASCAFLHPALDGLLEIMAEGRLAAADIERMTMRFPTTGAAIIDNNPLRSHCAQYVLPVAAVRGRVQFEDVVFDRSGEEEIRRLSRATSVLYDDVLDPDYPRRYTTVVEVTTRGGSTSSRRVEWARGCPENPMSDEEIIAKYRHLAGQRVDGGRVELILSTIRDLEQAGNLRRLFEALSVP